MLLKRQGIPRDETPEDETESDPRQHSLLSALRDSPTAAMASDARGRVVFWNRAAERVLSRSSASALGRRCHDLIQARDVFGNRFCTENCPVVDMARRNEAIHPFEWQVAGPARERRRKVQVQILRVPGRGPGQYTLVHLLEPIDEDALLSRLLSALQATPKTPTPAAGAAGTGPGDHLRAPEPARAGGARLHRARSAEQGDRGQAGDQPRHRSQPRPRGPRGARGPLEARGPVAGRATGLDPSRDRIDCRPASALSERSRP